MTNPDDRAAIEVIGLHLINNDYAEPDQAWPIAEAALAALRDAGWWVERWRPINDDTPKTIPPTLLVLAGGDLQRPTIGYWSVREGRWMLDGARSYIPAVWMPCHMPPPPPAPRDV